MRNDGGVLSQSVLSLSGEHLGAGYSEAQVSPGTFSLMMSLHDIFFSHLRIPARLGYIMIYIQLYEQISALASLYNSPKTWSAYRIINGAHIYIMFKGCFVGSALRAFPESEDGYGRKISIEFIKCWNTSTQHGVVYFTYGMVYMSDETQCQFYFVKNDDIAQHLSYAAFGYLDEPPKPIMTSIC